MKLDNRQLNTLWEALEDAVRDRMSFIEAYTDPYGKPLRGGGAAIIRRTKLIIARYRRLQDKIARENDLQPSRPRDKV